MKVSAASPAVVWLDYFIKPSMNDGLQQRPEAVAAGCEARVLTWNINGLKKVAASHGGVKNLLDQFNADIGANLSTSSVSYTLKPEDHEL